MTAKTYTIKPLEWEDAEDGDITASTVFHIYRVARLITGDYFWTFLVGHRHATQAEAKAACTADWQERLASVLDEVQP